MGQKIPVALHDLKEIIPLFLSAGHIGWVYLSDHF
jgi:hypothetical protein